MKKTLSLLFSFKDRVSRKQFFMAHLFLLILFLLLEGILVGFFPWFVHKLGPSKLYSNIFLAFFYFWGALVLLAAIYSNFVLDIKRLRDVGLSIWLVLLNISLLILTGAVSVFHLPGIIFINLIFYPLFIAYFAVPTDRFCKAEPAIS